MRRRPGGEEVKRLDAEAVAGGERHLSLGVPQDEGEHADEPVERRLAPLRVGGKQNFGVRLGTEAMARRGKLVAQLEVIVDLAIKGEPVAAVGIMPSAAPRRPTDR